MVVSLVVLVLQQQKLDDPNNTEVVYLDQLSGLCNLTKPGKYMLRTLRQSGNLQKDDQIYNSLESALKAGISTFKRAKIEYVVISKNTESIFGFRRPYHNHRGTKEGKKVGSIEIHRVYDVN